MKLFKRLVHMAGQGPQSDWNLGSAKPGWKNNLVALGPLAKTYPVSLTFPEWVFLKPGVPLGTMLVSKLQTTQFDVPLTIGFRTPNDKKYMICHWFPTQMTMSLGVPHVPSAHSPALLKSFLERLEIQPLMCRSLTCSGHPAGMLGSLTLR